MLHHAPSGKDLQPQKVFIAKMLYVFNLNLEDNHYLSHSMDIFGDADAFERDAAEYLKFT